LFQQEVSNDVSGSIRVCRIWPLACRKSGSLVSGRFQDSPGPSTLGAPQSGREAEDWAGEVMPFTLVSFTTLI